MSQSTTNTARRAQLLDGAAVAAQIKQETAREVQRLWKDHQVKPCLAAVLVGDDPASAVYVRNKIKASEEVGIRSEHHGLPARTDSSELLDLIASLNGRDDVDGILVQLPLPAEIDADRIIEAVDPSRLRIVNRLKPTAAELVDYTRFRLTPSGDGYGLGLAIAAQAVRAMRGEIAVSSDIGTGTVFTMTLPSATVVE